MSDNMLLSESEINLIQSNQIELADTMRLLLLQQHPDLFERLVYEDDRSFLEPSLFYLFSEKSRIHLPVGQILYGHFVHEKRPKSLDTLSDPFGNIYLSSYGTLTNCNKSDYSTRNNAEELGMLKEILWLSETIQLNEHIPFILYTDKILSAQFTEPVDKTVEKSTLSIRKAIDLLQKYAHDFWQLTELVTREISVI